MSDDRRAAIQRVRNWLLDILSAYESADEEFAHIAGDAVLAQLVEVEAIEVDGTVVDPTRLVLAAVTLVQQLIDDLANVGGESREEIYARLREQ